MKALSPWLALPAALLALTACTPAERGEPGAVTVEEAWARPTPPGTTLSAAYLVLRNRGVRDVRLVDAASPDAKAVELHEMVREGDMMRMRRLATGITVPGQGAVRLAPGGMHLMLIGLRRPLVPGDSLAVHLRFADGDAVSVQVPVGPIGGLPPMGRAGGHGMGAGRAQPPPMPHGLGH